MMLFVQALTARRRFSRMAEQALTHMAGAAISSVTTSSITVYPADYIRLLYLMLQVAACLLSLISSKQPLYP